ncbi:MAG: hypothetical protein ACRDIB_06860, partial [Ardenticatenaceae bacterium]
MKKRRREAEAQSDLWRRAFYVVQDAAKCLDSDSLAATICCGLREILPIEQAALWRYDPAMQCLQPVPADATPFSPDALDVVLQGVPAVYDKTRALVPIRL